MESNEIYIMRHEGRLSGLDYEGYVMEYSIPQRVGSAILVYLWGDSAQRFAEKMIKNVPKVAINREYTYYEGETVVKKTTLGENPDLNFTIAPSALERNSINIAIAQELEKRR